MCNHNNEPAEGLQYFAWKSPVKSGESNLFIQDYQFYEFIKKSAGGGVLSSYFCTIEEYQRLGENLKVPRKQLVYRELPYEERIPWWVETSSGARYYEPKFKQIPLNPDSFLLEQNQLDAKY